jgi:hypothetical protein
MSIEAMKQALEVLKNYVHVVTSSNDPKDFGGVVDGGEPARQAITALRQAIAEAEKPWVKTYAGGKPNYTTPEEKQVRTHTPEDIKKIESKWVGLTDEDYSKEKISTRCFIAGSKWAEAKLKEKNNG